MRVVPTKITPAYRQLSAVRPKGKNGAWWLTALGSSLVLSSFVSAQPVMEESIEEVIVTGSYIKSTPEDAPNPVSIIDREELYSQGSPSITEIIKNLGVSSGVDGDTNQFQSNGLEGAANVNLRGLGPGRALVLLNGKRLPYSGVSVIQQGYQQFININQIPLAALSRTEILRDGASATYGSDAISGVVNFITRSELEGFDVSLTHKVIEDSDGNTDLGFAFGRNFGDHHLLVALGYNIRSELEIRNRDYALRSYAENTRGGWSGLGNPGTYLAAGGVGKTFLDPGCQGFTGGPYGGSCRFQYTQYDNLTEDEQRYQLYGEFEFNFGDGSQLKLSGLYGKVEVPEWKTSPSYPPASNFLANVIPDNHPGLVQLVNDVNAGVYNNVGAASQCIVMQDVGGTMRPIWLPRGANGCPAALSPDRAPAPTAGANAGKIQPLSGVAGFYVDGDGNVRAVNGADPKPTLASTRTFTEDRNPTLLFIGRYNAWAADAPREGERTYEKNWFSADYTKDFGGGLSLAAALAYGAQETYIQGGDMLGQRLVWGLQGFGGAGCIPAAPTDPTNPTAGLTPGTGDCHYYNPFSNGLQRANRGPGAYVNADNPNYVEDLASSREVLDWLYTPTEVTLTTELLSAEVVLSGEFGRHGWAAGGTYREDTYKLEYEGFNNATNFPCTNEFITDITMCPPGTDIGVLAFLSPGVDGDFSESVFAGFGEVQWNLLDSLRIQTALRYEKYEDAGESLDYKLAARFDAASWLSLRGSLSSSFKAPQLAQNNLSNNTSLSFISPISTFKAVDTSTVTGGLDPESSQAVNLGVIIQAGSFFMTIDYWQNVIEDPIITESFGEIVTHVCPAVATGATRTCDPMHDLANRLVINGASLETLSGAQALNAASLNRIKAQVINGDELSTDGLDLSLRYTFGQAVPITVGAEWSLLNSYELSTANLATGAVRKVDHVGELNQPDGAVRPLPENKYHAYVRAELPVGGQKLNLNLSYRFIGEYKDERANAPVVDSQGTFDFTASYSFNQSRTRVFVNVDNLTDEEPPFAALDISYDPYTHSPLGRTVKFGVNHQF